MSALPPVPNPRILLVEDESGIADTVQYVLRS
ncbi:MAG: two-component system response regulator CreB, partial [Comamonadaceae bacterium]